MGGTALSVGATLAGSAISGATSGSAANTLQGGAADALALQKQIYGQSKTNLSPYINSGTAANNTLDQYLGLDTLSNQDYYNNLAKQYMTGSKDGTSNRDFYFLNPVTGQVQLKSGTSSDIGNMSQQSGYLFNTNAGYNVDTGALQSAVKTAQSNQGAGNANYGSLLKPFSMSDFQEDPGYQFDLSEGQKALDRSAASKGGLLSGAAAKAATQYNQDYASNEYNNAYNRYNTNQNNIYSRLSGVSNSGQQAAGTLAGVGQNYANASGGLMTDSASAGAAGQVGAANAYSTGLSSIGNNSGLANLANTYLSKNSSPYTSTPGGQLIHWNS